MYLWYYPSVIQQLRNVRKELILQHHQARDNLRGNKKKKSCVPETEKGIGWKEKRALLQKIVLHLTPILSSLTRKQARTLIRSLSEIMDDIASVLQKHVGIERSVSKENLRYRQYKEFETAFLKAGGTREGLQRLIESPNDMYHFVHEGPAVILLTGISVEDYSADEETADNVRNSTLTPKLSRPGRRLCVRAQFFSYTNHPQVPQIMLK